MTRLDPSLTPVERRNTLERVRSELTTGWQTADNSREKLTDRRRARARAVLPRRNRLRRHPGLLRGDRGIAGARFTATKRAHAKVPEMLHFGSWVGGDMDGLPDVHAKTIRESCARHHALIVNRYFLEAQRLAEKLSQSERRTPGIPQPLRDRIEHYKSVVPAARASAPSGHDEMPYRVLLGQIAERLRATYDHRSGQYERVEQTDRRPADHRTQPRGQPWPLCRAVPHPPVPAPGANLRVAPRDARRAPERRGAPPDRRSCARRAGLGDTPGRGAHRPAAGRAGPRRIAARRARSRRQAGALGVRGDGLLPAPLRPGRRRVVRRQHGARHRRRAVRAAARPLGGPARQRLRAGARSTSRHCSNRWRRSMRPGRRSPACSRTRSIAITWPHAATVRS